MMAPEDRYYRDPMFAALVDTIQRYIETMEITPTEVGEAAALACYKHEMRRGPRLTFTEVQARLIRAELERSDT